MLRISCLLAVCLMLLVPVVVGQQPPKSSYCSVVTPSEMDTYYYSADFESPHGTIINSNAMGADFLQFVRSKYSPPAEAKGACYDVDSPQDRITQMDNARFSHKKVVDTGWVPKTIRVQQNPK